MVTPTTCVNGEHSWTSVTCSLATRRFRIILLLEASTPRRKRRCLSQLFWGYLRISQESMDLYGHLWISQTIAVWTKVYIRWFGLVFCNSNFSNQIPIHQPASGLEWADDPLGDEFLIVVGSQKPQPWEPVKVSHIHKDSPYRDTLFIFKVWSSQHVKHPDLQVNTASCHIASADVQAYLVVIDGKHDSLEHWYVFRLQHGATW